MNYCAKYMFRQGNALVCQCFRKASTAVPSASLDGDEEFKKLELIRRVVPRRKRTGRATKTELTEPRYKKMPVDQDWSSVWPVARSFHPATVPLPLRQGYLEKAPPLPKFANPELMKIPNFLHLTPPAIKKHCEVLKKFCTPWPEGLKTDEDCQKHFPIEVISSDYCLSGPSIRDSRARIVTTKIKLSDLKLDYHARDKLLRLVGERHEPKTDILSLVSDRCPLKRQNYDYTMYLLTALYHESWKMEPWEHEKTEADMEKYFFEGSRSQKKMIQLLHKIMDRQESEFNEEEMKTRQEIEEYGSAVTNLLNEGENQYTMVVYKDAACRLLNIQPHGKPQVQAEIAAEFTA